MGAPPRGRRRLQATTTGSARTGVALLDREGPMEGRAVPSPFQVRLGNGEGG